MIELRGVSKRYGDVQALKNVSLEVRRGEVFAVIGSSGAGKTTLLRVISCLETDFGGEYTFDGVDVRENLETIRRRVTMVFQTPVMFRANVFDNVAYGLKVRGVNGKELRERVERTLEKLGIQELAGKNARKLSGGQKQRVAIARALVLDADVYAFDEPTANLDAENARVIEDAIREMRGEGKTIILATHNLFQAKRLADRVAYIEKGEIVEIAETKRLFENPEDERTRRFVEEIAYY
ncbi:ABC-type polar amino acid transport system, ATPase component [Geoglobus ahangari]|uniref:ABC-type polar amino acid transport system, ATPase component n=1 Tax=Geoglobus ahangari TaxID=113653 RepID=A0A0F7DC09_9EURY|nr:ATP-binding cassette domain-containing protein [Geoglobus ahangari]AKG92021.1 ABC-type polar amino acid transport system, ATPase component [Geoglobus ahangari]